MPYLSRIVLNPLKRGAQQLLTNPQRMHAAVEGCLPEAGRSGRLLWRQETVGKDVQLWVLSPDRPTFDHLVEQAGWIDNEQGAPKIANLAPLLNQIGVGRQFGYRAKLNCAESAKQIQAPTKTQVAKQGRSKRVVLGHRTVSHQLAWFTSRATGDNNQWGFTVGADPATANVQVIARSKDRFIRSTHAPPVVLDTATFSGVLTITDPDVFRASLLNGIGRGKAYGCGLITLAPPPHVVES